LLRLQAQLTDTGAPARYIREWMSASLVWRIRQVFIQVEVTRAGNMTLQISLPAPINIAKLSPTIEHQAMIFNFGQFR
jgi:hypothetical protein